MTALSEPALHARVTGIPATPAEVDRARMDDATMRMLRSLSTVGRMQYVCDFIDAFAATFTNSGERNPTVEAIAHQARMALTAETEARG